MALPELVLSGKYSDFTLSCRGHEFHLHQAIVCPQSPVITAALEGSFQEASSKVLKADEFDVTTVQHMISFLYSGRYRIDPSHVLTQHASSTANVDQNKSSQIPVRTAKDGILEVLLSHLRVNAIADYYNIQSLINDVNCKLFALLQSSQALEVLPRFAQQASKLTGDTAIHSITASTLAGRLEGLVDLQDFKNMDLESSLAVDVLRGCGTRIRQLQAEISTLQSTNTTESIRKARIVRNIESFVKMARRTKECRNCDAKFACYIEKHGEEHEHSYLLRCRKCRCRHQPE